MIDGHPSITLYIPFKMNGYSFPCPLQRIGAYSHSHILCFVTSLQTCDLILVVFWTVTNQTSIRHQFLFHRTMRVKVRRNLHYGRRESEELALQSIICLIQFSTKLSKEKEKKKVNENEPRRSLHMIPHNGPVFYFRFDSSHNFSKHYFLTLFFQIHGAI